MAAPKKVDPKSFIRRLANQTLTPAELQTYTDVIYMIEALNEFANITLPERTVLDQLNIDAAQKTLRCMIFILLNKEWIEYTLNNPDDTGPYIFQMDNKYYLSTDDKPNKILRDPLRTPFSIKQYELNPTQFYPDFLNITQNMIETICKVMERHDDANKLLHSFLDAFQQFSFSADKTKGCINAEIMAQISDSVDTEIAKLKPQLLENFLTNEQKSVLETIQTTIAQKPKNLRTITTEGYSKLHDFFAPSIGKKCLVYDKNGQPTEVVITRELIDAFGRQIYSLDKNKVDFKKLFIATRLTAAAALETIQAENAIVKIMYSKELDDKHIRGLLNQLVDPTQNRHLGVITHSHSRDKVYDPATGQTYVRTPNSTRGGNNPGANFIKKTPGTLLSHDGQMTLFDDGVGFLFDINQCYLKESPSNRDLTNPKLPNHPDALHKYIFDKNVVSNDRWWLSGGKKYRSVSLTDLRNKNKNTRARKKIPSHNEILASFSKEAIRGIIVHGKYGKESIENRLKAIQVQRLVKKILKLELPIIIITSGTDAYEYTPSMQAVDLANLKYDEFSVNDRKYYSSRLFDAVYNPENIQLEDYFNDLTLEDTDELMRIFTLYDPNMLVKLRNPQTRFLSFLEIDNTAAAYKFYEKNRKALFTPQENGLSLFDEIIQKNDTALLKKFIEILIIDQSQPTEDNLVNLMTVLNYLMRQPGMESLCRLIIPHCRRGLYTPASDNKVVLDIALATPQPELVKAIILNSAPQDVIQYLKTQPAVANGLVPHIIELLKRKPLSTLTASSSQSTSVIQQIFQLPYPELKNVFLEQLEAIVQQIGWDELLELILNTNFTKPELSGIFLSIEKAINLSARPVAFSINTMQRLLMQSKNWDKLKVILLDKLDISSPIDATNLLQALFQFPRIAKRLNNNSIDNLFIKGANPWETNPAFPQKISMLETAIQANELPFVRLCLFHSPADLSAEKFRDTYETSFVLFRLDKDLQLKLLSMPRPIFLRPMGKKSVWDMVCESKDNDVCKAAINSALAYISQTQPADAIDLVTLLLNTAALLPNFDLNDIRNLKKQFIPIIITTAKHSNMLDTIQHCLQQNIITKDDLHEFFSLSNDVETLLQISQTAIELELLTLDNLFILFNTMDASPQQYPNSDKEKILLITFKTFVETAQNEDELENIRLYIRDNASLVAFMQTSHTSGLAAIDNLIKQLIEQRALHFIINDKIAFSKKTRGLLGLEDKGTISSLLSWLSPPPAQRILLQKDPTVALKFFENEQRKTEENLKNYMSNNFYKR